MPRNYGDLHPEPTVELPHEGLGVEARQARDLDGLHLRIPSRGVRVDDDNTRQIGERLPRLTQQRVAAPADGGPVVVRLKLDKGSGTILGRRSPVPLYSEKLVTFAEDAGAYDQPDATGFIRLQGLRLGL